MAELDTPGAGEQAEVVGTRLHIKWKLEKFDGDKKPGQAPVEVLEGEDTI